MEIYYPVKNLINQNNLFGANPAEYLPLGQNGHPGNDFECPVGTPVYSPCDGSAFYTTDSDGGCGLYIRTPDNSNPQYNIILWHMPPSNNDQYPYSIPTGEGIVTDVKVGQLLGYSGNSGYPKESTGPHLHLGVMPIGSNLLAISPNNGYLGCVDPKPFYNNLFAEDVSKVIPVVQEIQTIVPEIASSSDITDQQKVDFLTKVVQFLKNLFFVQ